MVGSVLSYLFTLILDIGFAVAFSLHLSKPLTRPIMDRGGTLTENANPEGIRCSRRRNPDVIVNRSLDTLVLAGNLLAGLH
jgi:hypothetical protein